MESFPVNRTEVLICQMVITTGVAIASYGEVKFVLFGMILQLLAVGTESTRLILVQILLQVSQHSTNHSCKDMIESAQQFAADWAGCHFRARCAFEYHARLLCHISCRSEDLR